MISKEITLTLINYFKKRINKSRINTNEQMTEVTDNKKL